MSVTTVCGFHKFSFTFVINLSKTTSFFYLVFIKQLTTKSLLILFCLWRKYEVTEIITNTVMNTRQWINCKCKNEWKIIFVPNKPACCDCVWGCARIAKHILNIGGVRYIRNLKFVITFSGEGSSGTHCYGGCIVASIPTNVYVSDISERQF